MSEKLRVESHGDHILILTFNRPQVRNAVDPETMQALRTALENAPESTRVALLTGAEGHFCAGADIQDALTHDPSPDTAYRTLSEVYHPTQLAIRNAPFPVIAAVDGYAAGLGCDIALRCDLRVVSARARFAELFVRVGLIPDGGGTFMLPRLVGLGKALEMMFTGMDVHADEAARLGLANRVYPVESFWAEALAFAEELAAKSPLALRHGKRAMLSALEGLSYAEALQQEAEIQRGIFASEDGIEGFVAFMEKRPPVWKGR
jgi:enoyl-CoA hydratase/carnithine racemase